MPVQQNAKKVAVAWVYTRVLQSMQEEARRTFPEETGGVFMGYHRPEYNSVVVTESIGPGPRADHSSSRFCPDYDYQETKIAKHYNASGRRETYLGDWHTHPNAVAGHLSLTDCLTLRRIARHKESRAPTPIMAILFGSDSNWQLSVKLLRPGFLSFLPTICECEIRFVK